MREIVLGLIIVLIFWGCTSQDIQIVNSLLLSDILKKHNDNFVAYDGYAFDALINNIPVIEISNKEKIVSLKGYRDIASVHWQLIKPIKGDKIDIDVKRKRIKEHNIGRLNPKNYEINYHPLSDKKEDSPFIIDKTSSNSLPVGDYVFSLQVYGNENWDRKEIFVEIREDANASSFL